MVDPLPPRPATECGMGVERIEFEGVERLRVGRIVVTHHHEDHSGNLGAIDARSEARGGRTRRGVGPLAEGFRMRAYQRISWGSPGRARPRPLPDTIPLADGAALRSVPAPGHLAARPASSNPRAAGSSAATSMSQAAPATCAPTRASATPSTACRNPGLGADD